MIKEYPFDFPHYMGNHGSFIWYKGPFPAVEFQIKKDDNGKRIAVHNSDIGTFILIDTGADP